MSKITIYSESLASLSGESTLVYQDKAREVAKRGIQIVNFGIGQPDFPTFEKIREEAKKALDQGFTGYTPALGIDELRSKVSEYLNSRYSADVKKEEVVITPGAKMSLFMAFLLYLNQGDEVLMPDPSYYSYAEVVRLLGAKPIFSKTKLTNGIFSIDLEDLESKIGPKTKIVVLNNPANPTGSVFSGSEVRKLMEIVKERKVILLADEIYDNFVYDTDFTSVLSEPEWRDFVIYTNGFSKTFSMTGWRLGYIVARREVVSKLGVLAANTYTCATSFAQRGALAAFESFDEVKNMISVFKRRRDVMYSELSKIRFIKPNVTRGAFYQFPFIGELLKRTGLTAKDFAIKLIESKGVVTIPGEVFPLDMGKSFLRLSFAISEEKIREGVSKIGEFVNEITQ